MRNIIRVIVYVGLIGVGGLYRYQHPTRYSDLFSRTQSETITTSSQSVVDVGASSSGEQSSPITKSGESIITQLSVQLSGTDDDKNPFGETYITITNHSAEAQTPIDTISNPQDISEVSQQVNPSEGKGSSQPYLGEVADTSTCTTPRGRSIAGADWTLAFESDHANINNICVIEKRICTQGVLGGSYIHHTCYFNGQGGEYEYLGIRGSDSTTLINQAEQQLGIISSDSTTGSPRTSEQYVDDTQGVSNYALIDADNTPSGRTSNGGFVGSNNSQQLSLTNYDLGPIVARTPEVKISASKEAQINPNGNGVQGVVNNKGNSPRLSYSTTNIELESTGPAPVRRSCKTPWGTEVFHNQHVIAFQSSSVPQGQSCKSEFRTCTQGYLRGSYTQQTCTIASISNTNTNDPYYSKGGYYAKGKYYNNDYDYKYYQNGKYNTYRYDDRYYETNNYSYKSPRRANNNCYINGYGYVGHGSIFTMYEKSEVGPNESCRSITRMCDDGTLSGSERYRYTRCTQVSQGSVRSDPGGYPHEDNRFKVAVSDTVYRVKNPNSISPVPRNDRDSCYDSRFGTIEHSDSIKAFKTSTVKAGQKCEYEYRTCHNGDLDGSYKYNTCTIGSSNTIKPANTSTNKSISRYTLEDQYRDTYYVRRYDDEDRYYNKYNNEYYPSRGSRYDDYDSNVRSYGTKSDPQAGSCSVTNYGTLLDSDFLVMYRETNPAPGVACDSAVRTCNNGSLSGPSNYTSLRCSTTASVCGNGARESGEQCDPKDVVKSGRGSGGCSLACTPVQQITVIEEKCYDYTDTIKLCAGKNGGTIQDTCKQVRSCPVIDTKPGVISFIAWEEQNGNRSKDACELSISDVTFNLVQCGSNTSLRFNQTTYNGIIDNVTPGSYQIVAWPVSQYGKSGYYPQSSNPRPGDPTNTFRSSCFTVSPGSSTTVQAGFKAPMSINDKTHPRWIFDPVNGQNTGYPGC